jgi:endonuclease/exonuclease/phosphatase family metal-dependent hydrolase
VSRVRCLTLNLWGAEAPLDRRMAIVTDALVALTPDVVGLQEVREVPGQLANQAEQLARATGLDFVFASAVEFGGGHEGLAILARGRILEHQTLELPHARPEERRLLLSARVETASGTRVWVHTTHLNYRLHHGQQRQDQVLAIDAALATVTALAGDVPQILMGDFNARPESDEIRWLKGLTTLEGRRVHYQDAWDRLHPGEPGWTWASANPYTSPLAFLEPDRRIDYIFVTTMRRDGRGRIHDCRIVLAEPAGDGVYASDHFGLLAEVQLERDA